MLSPQGVPQVSHSHLYVHKGYTLSSWTAFSFLVKITSKKGNISSAILLKKDVSAFMFFKMTAKNLK